MHHDINIVRERKLQLNARHQFLIGKMPTVEKIVYEEVQAKDLFSRNVFAFETFFPMAEAFQEKYEPDGSTCSRAVQTLMKLLAKAFLM